MNVKRILTASAALAIIATAAANASTTATGTITVKWNTQAIGSMTVVSDYNGTGQSGMASNTTPTVYTAANGGAGACTATGGGIPTANNTVDFSGVTPDVAQATDCLYKNAANGVAVTSDSAGWSVATSATVPASALLCGFANGTPGASPTTSTRSAAVAGVTTTASTCTTAGGFNMASSGNIATGASSTTGTNIGDDIELALAANAASGAQSVVVTYTLTMN
jgi:hypothetical protein